MARPTLGEPQLQKVGAVRVDLQAPGIELFSTPSSGTAPQETTSETTGEFLAHYRLQVAINANFYAPCCTPGDKDLLGLAMSRGTVVSPLVAAGTAALVVPRDNHAAITKTSAGFAAQNYWTTIADSEIVLTGGAKPALADTSSARCRIREPRSDSQKTDDI